MFEDAIRTVNFLKELVEKLRNEKKERTEEIKKLERIVYGQNETYTRLASDHEGIKHEVAACVKRLKRILQRED